MSVQRKDALRTLIIGYGVPTITCGVFVVYWLLYAYAPKVYLSLLRGLEPNVWSYPFLDLESVLTAIDCARQGIDVTQHNACMSGGLFQYSPLLLKAATLPVAATQRIPLGLGLDGLFLLSFFALPRPRRWSEFWALLLAGLSTSVLFAVERANIDVAIYLLSFGAALLLLRARVVRIVGYGVILAAAAIKFYPASLMALAVRETLSRFVALALIAVLIVLLLVCRYHSEVEQVVTQLPQGSPFSNTFSATRLPEGIAWIAGRGEPGSKVGTALRIMLQFSLVSYTALRVWNCVPLLLPGIRKLSEKEQVLLVSGSLVTVFCFFLADNAYYREIFLIPTIPGWVALQRVATNPALKNCGRFATWAVVAILWSGFLRYGVGNSVRDSLGLNGTKYFWFEAWLLYEIFWWWLVSTLIAIILCFAWDSRAIGQLWLRLSSSLMLNARRNGLTARTSESRATFCISRRPRRRIELSAAK